VAELLVAREWESPDVAKRSGKDLSTNNVGGGEGVSGRGKMGITLDKDSRSNDEGGRLPESVRGKGKD